MRTYLNNKMTLTVFGLVAFLALTMTPASAQSDGYHTNSNLRGVVPFGSYQFGEIDNVNLATGAVNLRIPLVSRQGRGSSEGLVFVYSSKIWVARPIPDPIYPDQFKWTAWEPTAELNHARVVETSARGGELQWAENWYTCFYDAGYTFNVIIRSNFSLRAADGAVHQFPNRKVTKDLPAFPLSQCYAPMSGEPPPPAEERQVWVGYSDSGTMELDITGTSFLVRHKDGGVASYNGTQVGPSFQWYKDRNGNIIDINGDTLKRTTFKASDGQSLGYGTSGVNVSVTTQFPTTGTSQGPNCVYQYQGNLYVTTSLTLANGQQFTFEYDPIFRELTRVNLPTGGYIKYIYQTFPGLDDGQGNINTTCLVSLDSRRVVERRVSSDGVNEEVWTYSYPPSGATEVTDPLGDISVHLFVDRTYEYSTELRSGAGVPLRRTVNDWGGEQGPIQLNQDGTHQMGPKNRRITATTTTLLETNQVAKTETDYDQFTYQIELPQPYNNVTESRMNVTENREYDYGVGSPGPLARKTTFTYSTNANYLNRHIWGLLTSKKVYDGGGNLKAQSETLYDTHAIASTSGAAVQHDYANYGTGMNYRGNPTETKVWRNTDGAWLTSKGWYDDLGNVVQTQDPLGHNTFFSYADSWTTAAGGNTCAPVGGTAHAFVTQVTNHLGHVASTKYFSCSSLAGSTTDANNQTTTVAYDEFDRPVSTTRPDGSSTTWAFDDPNRKATTTQTIDNGVSPIAAEYHYDGLWRVFESRMTSDPQGTVYTVVEFDALGRTKKAWSPTRCSSPKTNNCESTWGITEFVYDELGRTTKVIPPDGTAGSNYVATSYSGNSVTVTDQAGKQRRSYTDALGRLIRVDEATATGNSPGTGSATMSGSVQTSGGGSATPGTGWVDISGSEQSFTEWVYVGDQCVMYGEFGCEQWEPVYEQQTTWDTGGVSVTINGATKSAAYGYGSTATSLATALANAMNADSGYPVTASASGVRVNLTSKASGSASNYTLSASSWTNYPGYFTSPSFSGTRSGPTLSGGTDATPLVYDSGQVWVIANGATKNVSYGQGSTASTVATALASAINGDSGYPVSASLSGPTLTLTAKVSGAHTNYSLAGGSSTSQPGTFGGPSFAVALSGSSLTGGTDTSTGSLATPAVTLYTYDTLDNLTCVVQKGTDTAAFTSCATAPAAWRPRSFSYNSLSQLLTASNPESGAISYSYDADGNLVTKADARGIVATHAYDALHRLTSKTYSNGDPAASFTYDVPSVDGLSIQLSVGRLVKAAQGNTRTVNSYNAVGQIVTQWQCTPLNCGTGWYTLNYTYNEAGGIATYTNGAGITFTQTYNSAGQITQLASSLNDAQHPGTLASGLTYNPAGALTFMVLGNGLADSRAYNNRFQPTEMRTYNPSTQADTLKLTYSFTDASGRNNGNVMLWAATGAQTFSRTYTYDELNRLKTMSAPAEGCGGLSWTYDIWGNRTHQTVTGGTCGQSQLTINTLNRIGDTGYSYDAAGNLAAEPGKTYQWDAEGRLVSINNGSVATYVYDAGGRRVRKIAGGVATEFVYGLSGNVVAEFQGTTWTRGYVYIGSKLVSQYSDATTYFVHKDHLGSSRVLTKLDQSNHDVLDYLPYGEQIAGGSSTSHKFTSGQRDPESSFDLFGVRYYAGGSGRFVSADPVLISPRRAVNPQIWNRYTYAGNNPMNAIDPTGLEVVQLGVHTDQEIDAKTKEINKQLKDKRLAKEEKKELQRQKKLLALEKEGNRVVGNLLKALDKIGERKGLTLRDFSLSTETKKDFGTKLGPEALKKAERAEAFVIPGESAIYVRTEPGDGFYNLSQRNSDYVYYGAAGLSHEQTHVRNPDGGEWAAYMRQDFVFEKFRNYFQNRGLYGNMDAELHKRIEENVPRQ